MRNALIALSLICLSACGGGGGGGSSSSNNFAGNWGCTFVDIQHDCDAILDPAALSLALFNSFCPIAINQEGDSTVVVTRAPSSLSGGVAGEGTMLVSSTSVSQGSTITCIEQDTILMHENNGDSALIEMTIDLSSCTSRVGTHGSCRVKAGGVANKE